MSKNNPEKIEWKTPPTLSEEVRKFVQEAFTNLESATYGNSQEFNAVLTEEAEKLQKLLNFWQIASAKNLSEIKNILNEQFEMAGDPEKTINDKKISSNLILNLGLINKVGK